MSDYKIYNCDCIEFMQDMVNQGKKVDCIITDPPYLINYKTRRRKDKNHKFCSTIQNDNNKDLIKEFINLSYKILKDNSSIYFFCNDVYIDFFKQEIEKYFKMKNILVWVKNNHTAGDLYSSYAKKTEFIIYATKGRVILNGKRETNVLFYDRVAGNDLLHQNQKPINLLEFLILKSSNENETILDPFMGSGSTGLACLFKNRNFIGCEIDKEYFEIAERRLKSTQDTLKQNLFYGMEI